MRTALVTMVLICAPASAVFAAEPPAAAPATAPVSAAPEPPAAESKVSDTDVPEAATGAEAAAPRKGASPQRFIPSEQVRADFDVSFPIDI